MLEAIYEPTGQKCYIGMDYVIDVFPHGKDYIAYTIDFDRGGYIIAKEVFEKWKGTEDA